MAYYQLFMHTQAYGEPDNGEGWCIDFGDKDKECVEFERDDHKDRGVKAKHIKLVRFDRVPTTRQLMAKRAELNGALATS